MMDEKVTYFAVSIFQSKTFWFNTITGIVAVLSATDVLAVIPKQYISTAAAVVSMGNIYLRTITVRPVALIAPGEVKAVDVPKIGPPDPPVLTD